MIIGKDMLEVHEWHHDKKDLYESNCLAGNNTIF